MSKFNVGDYVQYDYSMHRRGSQFRKRTVTAIRDLWVDADTETIYETQCLSDNSVFWIAEDSLSAWDATAAPDPFVPGYFYSLSSDDDHPPLCWYTRYPGHPWVRHTS